MHYARNIIKKELFSMLTASRQVAYRILGFIDSTTFGKTNPLFILSYHSVAEDDWRFSVDKKIIMEQILYIQKHFDIITLSTLTKYLQGKKDLTRPSVVLTFDDGYKDILTLKDFFTKHNIQPALFLLSNTKNPNWKELGSKRPFLTTPEIKSLIASGWEIGCHSATHANLATLSDAALLNEVVTSKKKLEEELGIPVPYFAYPRGKYNENVLRLIKNAQYQLALTMDDGFIKPYSDMYTLPRVGVDRTHTFVEFTQAFSPSVVRLRRAVKKSPIGRYL